MPHLNRSAARCLAAVQILVFAVFVSLGITAAGPAKAGPLITDGTFTATTLTAGGFICQNGSGVGSTCTSNLTDWQATCSSHGCTGTNTPGSILFPGASSVIVSTFNGGNGLSGTVALPPLGGNVIADDADSQYAQKIFQTVNNLMVGDRYQLVFYQGAAEQGASAATTEQWQVTFGTTQTSPLMNDTAGGVVPWSKVTLNFIATSTSEVLTFLSLGGPTGDPPIALLADVSLTDIPEPGSAAIIGCGALALLALRRRRA